jgi:N-acetylglucosaminylphosphatidylinositol deacetylase
MIDFFDAVKSLLLLVNLVLLVCVVVYRVSRTTVPGRGGDVLLVIAHPDDEAMFFAPFIASIRDSHRVHLLSLSSGNYCKLGAQRKSELIDSANRLGIQNPVVVIENDDLQDGSQEAWKSDVVADAVAGYLQNKSIATVVTFDENGVSSHSDHCATYRGIQ